MKINNTYKILFYVLLVPYILFVIYLFWPAKKEENQDTTTQDIQSTCQKELEATNNNIDEYDGVPKPVDFSDFPDAKTYFTMITKAVERGANFAGSYTLAIWGCGTDCRGFSVINVETGKVIAYNPVNSQYHVQNEGNYLVLEPVTAGQTREYYKIVDDKLELACSEISVKDMYGLPQ